MNNYAGFWIRLVATVLDTLVLLLPVLILDYLLFISVGPNMSYFEYTGSARMDFWTTYEIANTILGLVIGLSYHGWMVSKYQATVGKLIMGLRIVNESGEPISLGKAICRYLCYNLSAILYIGYLMVAFSEKKQGLHDKICKTYVVYK